MKTIFIIASILFSLQIMAQPLVKVEVSSDTIAAGEIVKVTYTIENAEGNFVMPDLTGLPVISGPNSSSSFMYQNGKSSSYQSYSFSLLPREEGLLNIPKGTYIVNAETTTIDPVTIVVGSGTTISVQTNAVPETPSSKTTREKRKF